MKIIFLEGDMSRAGGTERMTAFLANALCSEHKVYIFSLHGCGESFFELEPQVTHIRLPEKHQRKAIHRFLQKELIDIAVNVDTGMSIFGIPSAWGTKTKVITWEHSNYFNNWGSRRFPYIRRFAARHSDAMVVLTGQDKRNYETHIPSNVPVYAIANPVQRHEIHYDAASRTILSAGALLPIKGYDRAIEVAKRILPSRPAWKWVICGEGPEREHLECLIREAGLEKQVFLPGTLRDMEAQYRSAAMVVMTSHMEGLPMVLLEAKSYGLPLVSFDIMTGPRDIIEDGVNGSLIPPDNVGVMAEKICGLIDQPLLRKQFSENAALDMDKFDRKAIVEKWMKLFRSLI